jgi:hypothetical protein
MNTANNVFVGYAVAVGEIVFGAIGLITGWISAAEAMTVITLGLSTFGIHQHNVAVGRALGATR